MSSVDSGLTFILGLISGVIVGFVSFLLTDSIGQKRARVSATADLLSEMRQNRHHQEVSFVIPLEDDAYRRFRQLGLMPSLNEDVHTSLLELYSRIHNKNGLVAIYTESRGDVLITGGPKPETIQATLANLRTQIDNELATLIDIFQAGRQNDKSLPLDFGR